MAAMNKPSNFNDRFKPSIHPVYFRVICAYANGHGVCTEALLKGTLISEKQLSNENQFLSYEQLARLLKNSMRLTGRPWSGVELPILGQTMSHGSLGVGLSAAKNLLQALGLIKLFFSTRQRIVDLDTSEEEEDDYIIHIKEIFEFGDTAEHVIISIVNAIIIFSESVSGKKLPQSDIFLNFEEPAWSEHYYEALSPHNLHFNCESTQFKIEKSYLVSPCLTGDLETYKAAVRTCERLVATLDSGNDFRETIRTFFLDNGPPYPTQEELASTMNMSYRTLIRRLSSQDTTYQEILDEVRMEIVAWHLLNTPLSVEKISEKVGYQSKANFSRAFKRWYDMTPREYRNHWNS